MEIDPFVLRIDSYERGEPEKPPPKGEFADFCPVTYMKENWLFKCPDGNMELETTVFGKTFRFSGEQEMEEFKFNPAKFLVGHKGKEDLPLLPPPPKVMIIGQKGAGVTTQIDKLSKKYVIDSLSLKDKFTTIMSNEAEARKRGRLLQRGFKPPEVDEDGVVAPDPEIEDEAEEFDKEANEKDLIRKVFADSSKGYLIDGTWNGFAED
jgi:adenylate/nucleoside-diphosphate kinase